MQAWQIGFGVAFFSMAMGCSQSGTQGTEEDREEAAGVEEEQSRIEEDLCDGQLDCAWWTGRLLIEGKWWELDEIDPRAQARHCSETDIRQVNVDLSIPSELVGGSLDLLVLHISANPKKVNPGEEHEAKLSGQENPGRALAYLSMEGRAATAVFPDGGSLRYEEIGEEEALDLFFDLDYGDLGGLSGRVKTGSSQGKVCRMPDGPSPASR